MPRNFSDWLPAYCKFAGHTEAPVRMHAWAGISAIAGALRRKVWIDMKRFLWVPNFYVIFVAPPGVVAKSTTADISMGLLKAVPGIKFGPDVVTWQSLVTCFAAASEAFEWPPGSGNQCPMSPLTMVSSEFGNLVNPKDKEMVNLLIDLWDGRKSLEKQTKMSGNDTIEAPWINMIACTTPHWIADNMSAVTVGGGFTSRCIFLYADMKEKYIPWVDESIPTDDYETREKLIQDLEYMSLNLCGPFSITKDARDWYRPIYKQMWERATAQMDSSMVEGYIARKQTHMMKTAMILSVSAGDSLIIRAEDLQAASQMLSEIEDDMPKVFSRIGRSTDSLQAEKLIGYVQSRGEVSYEEAYRTVLTQFPDHRDFEGVLAGAVRAGLVEMKSTPKGFFLKATNVNQSHR